MSSPFFSVIVPTHNGAWCIRTMLDSIRKQTFKDYEVIVVCDACTDNTAEIAEEYGAVVLTADFHRDGLTRNAGIDRAKGEWILFADDDDWFMHEYVFSMLHEVIGKQGEQVLNFSYVKKNKGYRAQTPGEMNMTCWCRCCRRDFIGDTRFTDKEYGSDNQFFMDLMAKKPDIVFWNTPMYYYNANNRSVSAYLGREIKTVPAAKPEHRGDHPFFSIVIPAYNAEKHIVKALESIRAQTFTDYEIIVACDSCIDNTEEVAKSYGARTIAVHHHQDGLTRNDGLKMARGDWVLFLDDDDWYLHEYVFEQLAEIVGQHGEDILCFGYIANDFGYIRQLPDNGLSPCVWSKCWRRSFIEENNIRFSFRKFWSDTDFHNKAMRKPHKCVYWDMPLHYYYRTRKGNQSESAEAKRGQFLADKPVVITLTDPYLERSKTDE